MPKHGKKFTTAVDGLDPLERFDIAEAVKQAVAKA